MKINWKRIAAMVAAIIAALAILDVFCYWYYNPAEYEWEETRATDTIREPGVFTSRGKEGFAWATIDSNGYNNADVPGEDGVFALMMGSSHTEGLYVMQDEGVTSLLNDRLRESGLDGLAYNIGTSSHTFARNAANFERALERFRPTDYVVIETQSVKISKSNIEKAMNDSFERLPWTQPVISEWVSDRPLLRTLYRQWETFASAAEAEEEEAEVTAEQLQQYEQALTQLLVKMERSADEYGVQLIIYYHPHLMLQEDGSALPQTDGGCLEAFAASCDQAGVTFLDMTEAFLSAYENDHILPHGFSNTSPGTGHSNPDGNAIIADAICAEILEQEAAK